MEDRLADFRRIEPGKGNPVPIKNVTSNLMPDFSQKLKILQQSINQIKSNNQELINLKTQTIEATQNDVEKRCSMQLNHYTEINKGLCAKVKAELEEIQKEVECEKAARPNEPETRIKIIAYQAFNSKFASVLKEFQNNQVEYKNAIKTKIARQARIVDEKLTPEQIQDLVNDPEGAQRLFAQNLVGKAHFKIQNAMSDIQDKYNDIKRLEQSMIMIHEMFNQLALVVQEQGQTIDSIEQNLTHAQNYVKDATSRLKTAQVDHEKSKKWKWIVIMMVLIIAALGLFFALKP